jgi:heat shock protein HtpX
MATLYTHQRENVTKTWILMAGFFALLLAVGYFGGEYYGNTSIIYGAIILSVIMNFVGYWHSDKIALRLAGAKEIDLVHSADPSRDKEILRIVENLSITAGLPMPKVCIIEDSAPNAFATGRNKEHGAIAVTTGLLSMLDKNELEGVIAHELAHIGNRDTLLATIVVILVGLFSIISDITLRSSFK